MKDMASMRKRQFSTARGRLGLAAGEDGLSNEMLSGTAVADFLRGGNRTSLAAGAARHHEWNVIPPACNPRRNRSDIFPEPHADMRPARVLFHPTRTPASVM